MNPTWLQAKGLKPTSSALEPTCAKDLVVTMDEEHWSDSQTNQQHGEVVEIEI
ncbi:unannotated protein [freshwater metagenome]|uniref:Unannotated protein n=1 Tax=freshwater metagenome TaxID=449393 RepID=A0A6J7GSU5_9ZZZZ